MSRIKDKHTCNPTFELNDNQTPLQL